MKKCVSIILSLFIIFCVASLAACGTEQTEPLDAEATFNSLLNEVKYSKELSDVSSSAAFYFNNIPEGTDIRMYRTSGVSSDQLIMFSAKDAKDVETILASVDEYLGGLKKQAELYTPEDILKLKNAVIYDRDNYVFVCITEDTETVHQILGD